MSWYDRILKKVRDAVTPRFKTIARVVVSFTSGLRNMRRKGSSRKRHRQILTESVRSRVAMDFTGAVGRIVEDPQEANAIAIAEGYSWKRRWRPSTRLSGPSAAALASAHIQTLDAGVHMTQPWFHSGMTRDHATAIVTRYGTSDGVFLVRESRSNPGSFVLTYKCGSKVMHAQISPILDPLAERTVYSLDNGVTKFYDILQLIEFYQLNAGCLPTRLTHYVVQNGNTVVPTQDQPANTSSGGTSSSGGSN